MSTLVGTDPSQTKQHAKTSQQPVNQFGPTHGRNIDRLASIGEMVTTVAHESRNFLQRIAASTDMLSLQLQDDKEAMIDVERIREAQTGLHHLLESLREFAGPMKLDRQPCDLPAIWRAAWSQVNPAGVEAALTEQVEPLSFPVHVDEFRMAQVFRNLFENSRAACSDVLHVEVSCRPFQHNGNPMVRIVVQDNGPGLTVEQQQHLFEPFYTTRNKGTGLGMTITQRILEQHDGQILPGNGSGPGACFCITIPGETESTLR